ncbi:MAG: hypothetical protein CVU51_09790, partial [Deltaproteobacteria bacterium HGW-Deltaproteobacteria-1]
TFQIKEWLGVDKLLSLDAYKEYYGIDDIDSFLDVNFKVCRDVMCPANKDADEPGAKFVGGNEHAVVTPDSFKNVYKTVMDAELGPQFGYRGEGKIPLCWYAPILEMQSAASPSIVMFWCLTQGAITVLHEFATKKQQDLFIPKLRTGEWGGTMGLTEPGAGSEVGAVKSRAVPTDVPGKYKLTGTKCFISSGDHDLAENIIHLMLAKTPNAKEGTAGISLFIVPKFWVNDDGSIGAWNDVTTMGIEHKLGIHGSTTATLSMGENDNCYGWMVGEAEVVDGRGIGMKQMFAYMNEERLNTGLFSLGCIGSAYYSALDYAKIRVQSKHSTNPKGPSVRIIEHEDVRRMLLSQKSILEACRALIYQSYLYRDLAVDAAAFVANKKTDEFAAEFAMMADAMAAFKDIVDMNAAWTAGDKQMKQLYATRTLHAGARVYCGKLLLDQALLAAAKLKGQGDVDVNFYKGKIATARFYIMNHVPDIFGYEKAMKCGDRSAIEIPEESFM